MKIGIVGLGYIGSVTAVALAEAGYEIIGVDIDELKVNSLANGEPAIYEPGMKEMLSKNMNRLKFSTDYADLKEAGFIFVVVPTPTKNRKMYLEYVDNAVDGIKKVNSKAVIILKSTVLPGTARSLMHRTGMVIVSNPEFTKEGAAIADTLKPDRVVIGGNDPDAVKSVRKIWEFTNAEVVETTNENAEMIKYASNSFLAVKISYINEIANLCEKIPGCDVEVVAKGMGLDKRIAPYFLKSGIGFGGSCFPKDTAAFMSFSEDIGEKLSIVESAINVNENRINRVVALLEAEFKAGNKETAIGVLGLTFKAGTDDIRGSQAVKLTKRLADMGYTVNAYDPMAKIKPENVRLFDSAKDCIDNSDAVVIATEWPEFKSLIIRNKLVIDMRRILDPGNADKIKVVGSYG